VLLTHGVVGGVKEAFRLLRLHMSHDNGGVRHHITAGFDEQREVRPPVVDERADRLGVVMRRRDRAEVVGGVVGVRCIDVRHRVAPADVEELERPATGGLDLFDQVERLLDRPCVGLHAGDLRTDVQVQTAHPEAVETAGLVEELGDVDEVHAELAAMRGAHPRVRLGLDAYVDAQGHVGLTPERDRHLVHALQLAQGVDDDGTDARRHRLFDLGSRLGHAVEHDLPSGEPRAQRLPQLAAGIDLDVDAGLLHLLEDPQRAASLTGEEDLGVRVTTLEGVA